MLFNSFNFFLFFPIVTLVYFLLPHKFRWLHLLLASCVFYAAFIPAYILILFFTIIIDYIAGRVIENSDGRKRKNYLILSIVANVGVLAFFKYYNFFSDNINTLFTLLVITTPEIPLLYIILPIGFSFHTFHAMSYTIEVYRGHQKAERHFGIYSLYVMFYPQLVAGPIERPQNLLHQFHEEKYFDYDRVVEGLKLMLWGLFKKVVIADRLAMITSTVYDNPHSHTSIQLMVAAILFSFQIYCDFSGYSDIALGSARVMGFKLMKNFDRPYCSKSISEFWGRWHISLSTWFRDYFYISLGGNRVALPQWFLNLFLTFLVSGLWHGANWTFIIWGALHGVYLILAIISEKIKYRFFNPRKSPEKINFRNTLKMTGVFILVTIAWIFFRAKTISDAIFILGRLPFVLTELKYMVQHHDFTTYLHGMSIANIGLDFVFVFVLLYIEFLHSKYNLLGLLNRQVTGIRWTVYFSAIILVYMFASFEHHPFIYFQF
jgi:alginate O-acetyltransferase complex protein AlgI